MRCVTSDDECDANAVSTKFYKYFLSFINSKTLVYKRREES